MKFLNKYLSYLLVSFSFLIGYSSFVILSPGEDINSDIKNEIDVDNNTESKNKKVIFDFNDGNLTEDFTVNFESSTQLNLSQSQIESIPEPKYDNINHHFLGWYLTKSGLYEDSTSSLINLSTYDFLESETRVYAKYINQESTKDVTTNSNLTISPSSLDGSSDNVYFMTQSSIGETLVLGSNASINILYEDGRVFNDTEGNSDTKDLTVPRLEDAKVRVVLENDLILDGGSIIMSSITGYLASKPGNACPLTASYTAIDLNGFNIVLLNGAKIDGYGIITNSKNTGGIYAKDGTITTIFTILDYKGGGETTGPYVQANSPFYIYSCPYLNVECVFTNKSQLIGYSALSTNKYEFIITVGGKYSTYINLINNLSDNGNCLLEVTDGYLIKNAYSYQFLEENTTSAINNNDYINTDSFREGFIFCEYPENYLKNLDIEFLNKFGVNTYSKGIFSLNDISMVVNILGEIEVNLAYADFSVPPFFDISIFSSFVNLNLSLNFFKGSSLYVDDKSTIHLSNYNSDKGYPIFGRIAFLDAYPTDFRYKSIDTDKGAIGTTGNAFYISSKISSSKYESHYVMNGTFSFNTNNVDLNSNYKFYTIGGTLDCSDQAINSLINNSDKLRLNSSFFFPLNFYTSSGLTFENRLGSAYFYQMPLISNDKCYFQFSDQTIYQGTMVTDRLIKYNNQYYFYKYDTEQFYSQKISCTSPSNVPPNENEYNIKFGNVNGHFVECKYYNESTPYIIYGENTNPNYCAYIECCGAYISVETIQENGIFKPNLTSTNKVNINSSASRFGDIDVCKTPSRELLTCVQFSNNVWRFCLND